MLSLLRFCLLTYWRLLSINARRNVANPSRAESKANHLCVHTLYRLLSLYTRTLIVEYVYV